MPLHRTTTLAHCSPPKTVRATASLALDAKPRTSAKAKGSPTPFWDDAKMSRLNAAVARQKRVVHETHRTTASSSLPTLTRSPSLSQEDVDGEFGALRSPTTRGPPQLPTFAAYDGTVRDSRSPSISVATAPHASGEPDAWTALYAAKGLPHAPSGEGTDRWSCGGGAVSGSEGLSLSAPRSASFGTSRASPSPATHTHSVRIHRQAPQTFSPRSQESLAWRTSSTGRGSPSPLASAMAYMMPPTSRGAARQPPRTVRTFERTEQPRLGHSPLRCMPPTARSALATKPAAGDAVTRSVPGRTTVPMAPGLVVHTPRIRHNTITTTTATVKAPPRKKHKSKRKGAPSCAAATAVSTEPPVAASQRRERAALSAKEGARTGHRSHVDPQALSDLLDEVVDTTSPHTPLVSACSGHRHLSEPEVPSPHTVSALIGQVTALRNEVQHLEAVKSALQSVVGELVGQLGDAAAELDRADLVQQRQAHASQRLLHSVAADWALQQNTMAERLAMMEEQMLGL